jgi:hypothetical protein
MFKNFAENVKITKCFQGAANAVDCDIINMEQFLYGAFVVIHTGASDTDLVLTVTESDDVAGSTTATIGSNCAIYADTDMGTSSDTLAAQTAATAYTIDTGTAPNQMVVFEVDPAQLSAGYPCVYLADSGGNASNTCTIFWLGVPRYAGGTLPTAIA